MEMLSLFSATFQASVQTLRAQKKLLKPKFPMFSISDRENITSSISTLILFNAAFGVNPLANSHISEGFFSWEPCFNLEMQMLGTEETILLI